MKKAFWKFTVSMILCAFALVFLAEYVDGAVFAQSGEETGGTDTSVDTDTAKGTLFIPGISNYGDIPKPDINDKDTITLIREGAGLEGESLGLLGVFKYIIGAVAVLMIIISGIRMVTAQGNEEEITNNRKILMMAILGLVLISMSTEIGKILSFDQGSPIGDPNKMLSRVVNFDKRVRIIITFIKYIVGSVAVLMIVKSGMVMVTQGAVEETMTKEKKSLGLAALGLVLIVMADTIIRKVFYKIDTTAYPGIEGVQPGVDPYQGVAEIVGITNFVVTFISPIAVLVFIIGGIMYLTAGDEEEQVTRARRMMIAGATGILVIYGAFALVTTFISGRIGPYCGNGVCDKDNGETEITCEADCKL